VRLLADARVGSPGAVGGGIGSLWTGRLIAARTDCDMSGTSGLRIVRDVS
jgi:hypothetical protein